MIKPYKGPWVMRTFLFVPGHNEKLLIKGSQSKADCVALCLEDAVPLNEKANARQKVKNVLIDGLFKHKPVFVRINSIDTGFTLLDLEAVACKDLDGFVYPMAYTADDVKKFDAQLSLMEAQKGLTKGHFSIVVLIETPLAVINAYDIAKASDRVVAILFGCEDYMAEMESRYSEEEQSLFVPRSMVAIAARAAGVVPLDTPYVNVYDLDGLNRFATQGRDLGMAGMLVMSPRQIEIAHDCYTPGKDEIDYAAAVVSAAKEAENEGKGIAIVDGKFISPPTLKQSKKLINHHEAIKYFESLLTK